MATLVGQRIVVEKTYAQMAALILAAELNPFLWYKITDRGDNGLVFRAAAVDRLESTGIRYMLCPATYAIGLDAYDNDWIGVWNATKQATATEGQLTIWNGLVWVAGAVLSGDAPDVTMDGETPVVSGWTVIPKASFTNHEYIEIIFNVCYDFDEDWISRQWDGKGNILGGSLSYISEIWGLSGNPVDYCDWNISTNGVLFFENKCLYIFNNNVASFFAFNSVRDGISYCNDAGQILSNVCDSISHIICAGITSNKCLTISNVVLPSGQIQFNNINGNIHDITTITLDPINIQYNINNGSITGVWDTNVTDAVVDKTGTAEATTTAP